MSRHNGGRWLASVEMCARTEENNLAFCVKMSSEPFLGGVKISHILYCVESKEKTVFKREIKNENIARKKCMGSLYVKSQNKLVEKTWEWMRKSDLKMATKALIFPAQEQALRTNVVKCYIDKTGSSHLCRL